MTVMALAGAACGGQGSGGEDGTGLDGPDRTLAWQREVLYEVGGADAEGWAAFGDVANVGFDAAGNLYVLDGQASQIHVIGPDGNRVRSMGTPGQGPGELGRTNGMTVFPDGTVTVFDFGRFSLVTYGPDGRWIRDVRIDPSTVGFPTAPMLPLPYHTVLAAIGGRMRMGPDAPEPEPGRAVVAIPLDEEAGEPDEVLRAWEAPPPEGDGEETTMRGQGGNAIMLMMPKVRGFTPALRLAVLGDGRILVADTTTYRIAIHGPDGMKQDELARPIRPTVVTPAIEDKERQNRLTTIENAPAGGRVITFGGGGGSMQAPDMTEMMRNQTEQMVFYPEIQVIERISADWDDRIWVQRASGEPGEDGPTDVITPAGGYLGTVPADGLRIPDAFGPDGLAVWIETDEFDAERVVVARIVPARQ
jgi:hypothetical protein